MAKKSQDREDLLRDAVAYVRRIEFHIDGQEPVFVGFREGSEPSFYFGQDFVLQFNAEGGLRRAFWKNRPLATYQHKLHWLSHREGRVRLARTQLTDEEYREFENLAKTRLRELHQNLLNESLSVKGEVPLKGKLVSEICRWLESHAVDLRKSLYPGLKRIGNKDR